MLFVILYGSIVSGPIFFDAAPPIADTIGVVVTDYEMQSMNGIELVQVLRRVQNLANVAVVMAPSND